MKQGEVSTRRILVVEDDADLRQMYRLALSLVGYEVLGAGNGIEALTLLEQHPPDLVLLDLGLPALDGFAVQQEITARGGRPPVPIVVVTGLQVSPDSLPVPCVLRKPVTPDQIVWAVAQCLDGAGYPSR
jgi:CheY-like chemotaxis protein